MTQEGGTKPPIRHPIPWQDPAFYDKDAIETEMERVFDICHGCRRCFNLCDSFPRLFDLIDATQTGELDGVDRADFGQVVEACTLCDMCFMTKCPYVPPHPFQLDFPHLMLRARAAEHAAGNGSWMAGQLSETDRNGKLARPVAGGVNWATKTPNALTRPLMEKVTGIDQRAILPTFSSQTFLAKAHAVPIPPNPEGPGFGERVVLYASCFVNYNNHAIGQAARAILAHNGVDVEVVYPECCGMPQIERGDVGRVADKALRVTELLAPWVARGYKILSPVPSCSLMLRMTWPLLWPDNDTVKTVAAATVDVSAYLVTLSKTKGLLPFSKSLPEGIMVHIPCHSRAQNQGRKAQELLQLIPDTPLEVLERCSGHGGAWGYFKKNFETALKVGRPVARQVARGNPASHCVSECPLAASHIQQGASLLKSQEKSSDTVDDNISDVGQPVPAVVDGLKFSHPLEVLAYAYDLVV